MATVGTPDHNKRLPLAFASFEPHHDRELDGPAVRYKDTPHRGMPGTSRAKPIEPSNATEPGPAAPPHHQSGTSAGGGVDPVVPMARLWHICDVARVRVSTTVDESLLDEARRLRSESNDAAYIGLAEALNCELVTADARLAYTPGPRCQIRLVQR